ncbi:MAG: PAS domain S-box protein, partial [Burkholderiaceae bacterium]|nr:PAS domain S-box protein [Burkholderiaceae bacterium]
LRANSLQTSPKLVPNALAALLITLTLALASSGLLLWRDTRRRLAAEQALREQHAFRKAMEDSLMTGLCARDLRGRITYVNPAFCEMTGFRADELVGASPPLPYRVPGQRDEAQRPEQIAGAGSARHGYETEFRRRDGECFPVLIFEAPLIDEHGRQTGWMDSILDIAERRRVEEINRRQQEKLQGHARMAMLGEVASALSHELNQPLAAITSYATACENMLREPGDARRERDAAGRRAHAAPAALRAALERIRSQSERAGQVIRGVQAFVRRRRIEREPIAIDQLVHGIEPLIRLQARKWEAQLVLDLCQSAIVFGDRTMLEQAVLNLTRNAAEAMDGLPRASRRLEIEAGPYHEAGRDWIRVAVKDCGCGIAADVESQLFAPFFTTKPDGLGIGLSLSRSVIEAHGGKLRHERRAGRGSVFAFVLPRHRAPATPASAADEPVAAA